MADKNITNSYTADSIQVLEGLDAVRKRPGMYIGSTNIVGFHQLVWEVVNNSTDEAMSGYGDKITVTIHKNGSITIADEGRGSPQALINKPDNQRYTSYFPHYTLVVNLVNQLIKQVRVSTVSALV